MPQRKSGLLPVVSEDDFRPRVRSMSPSIIRRLRPKGSASPRDQTLPTIPSSREDLQASSDRRESLRRSILKKGSGNGSVRAGSASFRGSLPELSADTYIEECINRASQESLTFNREPLPRGSQTFETVMTELGSQENVSDTTEQTKVNKTETRGNSAKSARVLQNSPVTSRRVHWNHK